MVTDDAGAYKHSLADKTTSQSGEVDGEDIDNERSYPVLFVCNHYIIALDAVHPQEGQRFIPKLQPNGNINLIEAKKFSSKNTAAGSSLQTNPADGSEDSLPSYQFTRT